jgi:DNA-binding transcriptional MocR family regulator
MPAEASFRYEELAGFITGLVDRGVLPPGSRVPSLRQISSEQRISISTALQAYRLLEDRGVIEARPQSGYYVARGEAIRLREPGRSRPPGQATSVTVSSRVPSLLEHSADPRLAPLGCAIPSAEVLAAGGLDRFLARTARVKGSEYNTYTSPRGDARLRQEIARRALRWGQVVSPDEIVITCGCTEALVLALKSVASAGDTIAVESPTYFGLLHALEALDLKALELPTDATTGIDLGALEEALKTTSITACLFASSFNNPLGCTMPEDNKLKLLDLLAEHDVPLIEDDIYGDIFFGRERPRPFIAHDRRGGVIYCNSFSKTIAPGYRVGWVVAPGHMREVLDHKLALTLCGPALPQAALADFLASGGYDHHLRRLRRTFADNIGQMLRGVAVSFPENTRVSRPSGGFVLWLELPAHINTRDLFDKAVASGICFAPGDVFSASDRYGNCLRLSCGHKWDKRLERAVARLGEIATESVRATA